MKREKMGQRRKKLKESATPSVNMALLQRGRVQGPRTRRSAKRAIPATKPYLDMLDVTEVCTTRVFRGGKFLPTPDTIELTS